MTRNHGYARHELLAEPALVWERRGDPALRLVDCGTVEAYRRAHLPGAVRLPVHHWLKDPADSLHVLGPEPFAAVMGSLGIGADVTVVAYDDAGGVHAARLWWALTYYGHTDVKVLHGGWQRWRAEGRPTTDLETVPLPTRFTPRPTQGARCGLDELLRRLKDPGFQVLDARSEGEYLGFVNEGNRRAGHIPGAINVEWKRFLTSEALPTLRPARELQALLQTAGLEPDAEVVTHCQAGVRGAYAFVLTLVGYRARLYDASMAEYANRDDTPLVVE